MIQAIFTGVNATGNDDGNGEFTSPFNNINWGTTESNCAIPVLVNGSFKNFKIVREVAPGAGTSVTYTFRKNGVNTALAVTISGTNTTGEDIVNSAAFTVGDKVSLICNYTGGVAPGYVKIYVEFENTDNHTDSIYGSMNNGAANSNEFNGIFNGGEDWSAFATGVLSLCPINGTLLGASIVLDSPPGGGNSITFVIVKNSVDQDGSGGTPDTRITISGGAATSGSANYSLSLLAGDIFWAKVTYVGSISRNITAGYKFRASTPFEFAICGVYQNQTSGTQFEQVQGVTASTIGTEAFCNTISGPTKFRLGKFYARLSAVPGGGASRTIKLRKNTADAGQTITFDSAESGVKSDLSTFFDLQNTDQICTGFTSSGAPALSNMSWGIQAFDPSGVVSIPIRSRIGAVRVK